MREQVSTKTPRAHHHTNLEETGAARSCWQRTSGHERGLILLRFEVRPEVLNRLVCLWMQSACCHSFCDMRWYVTVGEV